MAVSHSVVRSSWCICAEREQDVAHIALPAVHHTWLRERPYEIMADTFETSLCASKP